MDIRLSIEDTRKGFEESFASGEFYNRQTQDSDHMEKILKYVKIRGRMDISSSILKQDYPEYYSKYDYSIMELDHLYNYLCQKFIEGQGVY